MTRTPRPPFRLSRLALALALTLPWASPAVQAQSVQDLVKQLNDLKQQVQQLESQLHTLQQQQPGATAAPAVSAEEFNRIKTKAEALEDSKNASGFAGLKLSGSIDPTYIVNSARGNGSFSFMNDYKDGITGNAYTYDNSTFGLGYLDIQKEMDEGVKWRLTLAPHKSAINLGSGTTSIVNEASVSVPLIDRSNTLIAGVLPDWTGYDYVQPPQSLLITHNLLFDFASFSTYTGVGLDLNPNSSLRLRLAAGGLNIQRDYTHGTGNQGLVARADYTFGEFSGFGVTGITGRYQSNPITSLEADYWYTRGDFTLGAQANYGTWKNMASNGGDALWSGLSLQGAYKLTPTLQAVLRADYLKNSKNGGGNLTYFGGTGYGCGVATDANGNRVNVNDNATGAAALTDCQNGFGPGITGYDGANVDTTSDGVNRYALVAGLNYAWSQNVIFKLEYRYDAANQNVFYYTGDDKFKKYNQLLGLGLVVYF